MRRTSTLTRLNLDAHKEKLPDLWVRTLSSCVIAIFSIALIALGVHGTLLLLLFVGAIMLWEWSRIVLPSQQNFLFTTVLAGFLSSCVSYAFISPMVAVIIFCLSTGLYALKSLRRERPIAWMLAGYTFIFVTVISFIELRAMPESGLRTILWIISTVIATDVGGYFAGRLIGGPKLAPKLSPNKTWAGLVGGWIFAIIICIIFSLVLQIPQTIKLYALAMGVAMSAQIGDLCESYVKRVFGVKDASKIIPGHGGVLDRVDGLTVSILFVTVIKVVFGVSVLV